MIRNNLLKRFLSAALAMVCALFCFCACAKEEEQPQDKSAQEIYWSDGYRGDKGLTVRGSQTYLAGKKYNAIGLNVYDLLTQTYATGKIEDAYRALKILHDEQVPVVRFTVVGHGYKDYRIFFSEKEKYLNFLDLICRKAEELRVGLIPCFFWLTNGLPDYIDAPIRSWNDKSSKTSVFALDFTQTLVSKFKDYKSVWGYEFGNEHNSACNLQEKHLPPLPENSARTRSLEEDGLTADDISAAMSFWADKVRSVDPSPRLVTSGNSILRNSQYHLAEKGTWEVDTAAQKELITAKLHPDGVNTVSEHLYHFDDGTSEYLITENDEPLQQNFIEHIRMMSEICKKLGKAYFVGEFGYDRFTIFETDERIMTMRKMALAALDADVPLMLVWNFSLGVVETEVTFYPQDKLTPLVFDLIREINADFAQNNAEE